MVSVTYLAVAAMFLVQSAVAVPNDYGYDKTTTVYKPTTVHKYKVSKLPTGSIPILDG